MSKTGTSRRRSRRGLSEQPEQRRQRPPPGGINGHGSGDTTGPRHGRRLPGNRARRDRLSAVPMMRSRGARRMDANQAMASECREQA